MSVGCLFTNLHLSMAQGVFAPLLQALGIEVVFALPGILMVTFVYSTDQVRRSGD